jgi:hypothetical protein
MAIILDGTQGLTYPDSTTQSTKGLPLTGGTLNGGLTLPSAGITFSDASTQTTSVSVSGLGGSGQSWQNVTSSRAAGTTYTNSTGKPIQVVGSSSTGSSVNLQFYINGFSVQVSQPYNGANGIVSAIVPNGATYRIDFTNTTVQNWYELR